MGEMHVDTGRWAIQTRALRKTYGGRTIVDGVDLQIRHGEVFALLGPNGAGKTTIVEILQGIRLPVGGEVHVLGENPARYSRHFRDRIGVVPQSTSAFDDLQVAELLRYLAASYSRPMSVARALEFTDLAPQAKQLCRTLSGGQRRRVDIAIGLIGDPDLIFLDEPTTGLDPQARRHLWAAVEELSAAGKTVLLTTHYLDEAEYLADTVGILLGGKLVDIGPPDQIGGRNAGEAMVTFEPDGRLDVSRLRLPSDSQIQTHPERVTIRSTRPTEVLAELIPAAARAGIAELGGLRVGRPSLEETYLGMIVAHDQATAA